jgi:hypothetical protein
MECREIETLLYQGIPSQGVEKHLMLCRNCAELHTSLEQLTQTCKFEIETDPRYHEFRKYLILQKVNHIRHESAYRPQRFLKSFAASVLIACLLTVAYFEIIHRSQHARTSASQLTAASVNFRVTKVDRFVQLHWNGDPQQAYRVYRGTSPKRLQPVGDFKGLQWVDASSSPLALIFYKIEAL